MHSEHEEQWQQDFRKSVGSNALWEAMPPILVVLFALFVVLAIVYSHIETFLRQLKKKTV